MQRVKEEKLDMATGTFLVKYLKETDVRCIYFMSLTSPVLHSSPVGGSNAIQRTCQPSTNIQGRRKSAIIQRRATKKKKMADTSKEKQKAESVYEALQVKKETTIVSFDNLTIMRRLLVFLLVSVKQANVASWPVEHFFVDTSCTKQVVLKSFLTAVLLCVVTVRKLCVVCGQCNQTFGEHFV